MTIQRIKSGLFIFGGGCNRSKQVQPLLSTVEVPQKCWQNRRLSSKNKQYELFII